MDKTSRDQEAPENQPGFFIRYTSERIFNFVQFAFLRLSCFAETAIFHLATSSMHS
jgi:hypothetical protein